MYLKGRFIFPYVLTGRFLSWTGSWQNSINPCLTFSNFVSPQNLRTELDRNVKELAHFKSVMQTINTIQTTTLTVELRIHEMQEIYSIMQEHRIKVIKQSMLVTCAVTVGQTNHAVFNAWMIHWTFLFWMYLLKSKRKITSPSSILRIDPLSVQPRFNKKTYSKKTNYNKHPRKNQRFSTPLIASLQLSRCAPISWITSISRSRDALFSSANFSVSRAKIKAILVGRRHPHHR